MLQIRCWTRYAIGIAKTASMRFFGDAIGLLDRCEVIHAYGQCNILQHPSWTVVYEKVRYIDLWAYKLMLKGMPPIKLPHAIVECNPYPKTQHKTLHMWQLPIQDKVRSGIDTHVHPIMQECYGTLIHQYHRLSMHLSPSRRRFFEEHLA